MQHFDFTGRRVVVIGDLMLDRYLKGTVGRISPEAPVPVVLRSDERAVLGGAANVAANIASLGARVELIGVIGADAEGIAFGRLLDRHPRIDTRFVLRDPDRPTTCKTRVMSGSYQLIRLDAESRAELSTALEAEAVAAIGTAMAEADVIVLSDYAKGMCTDAVIRAVIERAAAIGKPSLVDPKRKDFSIYRGAGLIKPNRGELTAATGLPCGTDAEVQAAAAAAMAVTGSAFLVTRSEHGMSYFAPDAEPLHIKTAARDVFDVSGAGDTVMALGALGVAQHLRIEEIMRLANLAAGLVVGRVGTAVITAEDLDQALDEEVKRASPDKGAVVSLADAVRRRDDWRRRGLKVGFTNGCFDLLHPGHVSLLQFAASHCDRLIVAINTDGSVRRLKEPGRPIQGEEARAFMLTAMSAVDLVVTFDEETPVELIRALQPDLLVKGADYTIDRVVGAEIVQANGGSVLLAPLVKGQSTTAIVRRMTPLEPART